MKNNTKREFTQLSNAERLLIQKLHRQKVKQSEIARLLGKNRSTICRQLNNRKNKDFVRLGKKVFLIYSAKKANENYACNKGKCGAKYKLFRDEDFVKHIEEQILKFKLSPDVIVGTYSNACVCSKTIYNYIQRDQLKVKIHHLHLKVRRKARKTKVSREHKKKLGKSIELRPDNINNRKEFGHFEADCIVDKNNNAILVTQERLSRKCILMKLNKHESKEVLDKIGKLKYKLNMKSITADNGSEFYKISQLEDENFNVYFTHPYSSWEKGSIENLNSIIRRYIPKGTDLSKITEKTIECVQEQVNNLPRKILNYKTAAEVFEEQKAQIA